MTFVGKLLVVVQLVLAVGFMAFAGAVYTAELNWRDKHKAAAEQAAKAQQDATTATQTLQQREAELGGEITRLTQDVALRDSQIKETGDQLLRAQQERDAARTSVDRTTAVANISSEHATAREEETLRLRDLAQRLQSQINNLQNKNIELEDTLFARNREVESMVAKNDDNIKQLATYRKMILALKGSLNPEDYDTLVGMTEPPPQVSGKVLGTKVSSTSGDEFVQVSLGSDDGFKTGDTLEIFRGEEYLGKLELTLIDADSSVGKVVQRPRNGTIQKGDDVSPRI